MKKPNRELTDDEHRLLAYLYECDKHGRRPSLFDTDMTAEQVERAAIGLRELGFIEST